MLKQSCKHISNVFVNMSGLEPNIVKFVKICTVFRQTFQSFLKPSERLLWISERFGATNIKFDSKSCLMVSDNNLRGTT